MKPQEFDNQCYLNSKSLYEELQAIVGSMTPAPILRHNYSHRVFEIETQPASLIKLGHVLHDTVGMEFHQLSDITAIDWPQRNPRFDVVYHLLSFRENQRVRIIVATNDIVPSVCELWPAANWYEREVWDMFGVKFSNHPDLRRLLTDYGFEGHPLRKDFPLSGHVELFYDTNERRIVKRPVETVQDYRSFDFTMPWPSPNRSESDESKPNS